MGQIPTQRLYYEDAYLQKFTATVTGCEAQKDGFTVTLDRTAFYPEGGGQPADHGILGDAKVLDVQEQGGRMLHTTDRLLEVGTTVEGIIDWPRRFLFMQQHTGEHIVSGITHRLFQWNNVGFHMGAQAVTVDFNGELTTDQIAQVEHLANQAVYENLPVQAEWPSKEELEQIDYRSKKELAGEVRIVTIPGYDCCACCGLHTAQTGEVGAIKVVAMQRYKGGVRVTLQFGSRALADYDEKLKSVTDISVLLSAKPEEVVGAVERLLSERDHLRQQVYQLQQEIFAQKVAAVPEGQERVCFFEEGLSPDSLRNFCLALSERARTAVVFSGTDADGWKYAIAGKEDVRPLGRALNQRFSGRGGGKAELVQGSVQGTRQAIESFILKDLLPS